MLGEPVVGVAPHVGAAFGVGHIALKFLDGGFELLHALGQFARVGSEVAEFPALKTQP
ncbi:hypothetical protein D3C86_2188440 [compost metagenome]